MKRIPSSPSSIYPKMPVPQPADLAPADCIPVIDLAGAWSADNGLARRMEIAAEVRRASESVGFFYVKNHGIPEPVLARALALSRDFFALSDAQKMAVYQPEPLTATMGYRPVRDSDAGRSGQGDLLEGISFEWQSRREPNSAGNSANQWPKELPAMREGVLDYYDHANELSAMLYRLIALAMGVEEDFFESKTKSKFSRMRLLHYPEQKMESIGIGAHGDFGTFTVLLQQAGLPGLQVLNEANGEWIDAPPVQGTLVVNLGDQTSRWTNGHFKSAKHRVLSRPGADRYSIPLFYLADFDVTLEPIETFVSPEMPRVYESQSARDQLVDLVKKSYGN